MMAHRLFGRVSDVEFAKHVTELGEDEEGVADFILESWPGASCLSGKELADMARRMIIAAKKEV